MAEPVFKERLQPSLLDRLTDDEPYTQKESRNQRRLSMAALKKAVLRDLGYLFNSTSLEATQSLDDYPLAKQSVINYGLPDLAGHTASGLDPVELMHKMRQLIWDFEPRILRETLSVQVFVQAQHEGKPNHLFFEIQGRMWGQNFPENLYLRTDFDLEAGEVKVTDMTSAS